MRTFNNYARMGNIYIGENKIDFGGNVRKQHFITFITFLKNKLNYFMNFADFKLYIRELLRDEVLLWFTYKESEF